MTSFGTSVYLQTQIHPPRESSGGAYGMDDGVILYLINQITPVLFFKVANSPKGKRQSALTPITSTIF